MARTYVKLPVPVEAVQWTGSNKAEIEALTKPGLFRRNTSQEDNRTAEIFDPQHGSWIGVHTGDYVLAGGSDDYWAVRKDIFERTYVPAEDQ